MQYHETWLRNRRPRKYFANCVIIFDRLHNRKNTTAMGHLLQFLCHVTSYRPINCQHSEDSYSLKTSVNYVNAAQHYRKAKPLNVSLVTSNRVCKTRICYVFEIHSTLRRQRNCGWIPYTDKRLDFWFAVLNSREKITPLPSLTTQKALFSTPTLSKRQISQMIFLKTSRPALPPFSL